MLMQCFITVHARTDLLVQCSWYGSYFLILKQNDSDRKLKFRHLTFQYYRGTKQPSSRVLQSTDFIIKPHIVIATDVWKCNELMNGATLSQRFAFFLSMHNLGSLIFFTLAGSGQKNTSCLNAEPANAGIIRVQTLVRLLPLQDTATRCLHPVPTIITQDTDLQHGRPKPSKPILRRQIFHCC